MYGFPKVQLSNRLQKFDHDVDHLSATAGKGQKSQYLVYLASAFALKAVSSTDKNPKQDR